jgi:hypothetical protein
MRVWRELLSCMLEINSGFEGRGGVWRNALKLRTIPSTTKLKEYNVNWIIQNSWRKYISYWIWRFLRPHRQHSFDICLAIPSKIHIRNKKYIPKTQTALAPHKSLTNYTRSVSELFKPNWDYIWYFSTAKTMYCQPATAFFAIFGIISHAVAVPTSQISARKNTPPTWPPYPTDAKVCKLTINYTGNTAALQLTTPDNKTGDVTSSTGKTVSMGAPGLEWTVVVTVPKTTATSISWNYGKFSSSYYDDSRQALNCKAIDDSNQAPGTENICTTNVICGPDWVSRPWLRQAWSVPGGGLRLSYMYCSLTFSC